ncbi:hypothetical protein DRH29_05000 [candidate division Kazan bacterium]|uniref:Uncharacterized protein n=1 Tax=candidate division Kazan bacterium TaxID=2202143 RepID=A0A420ZBH1_UNCK3|nr:MAG: hypothetical protein DRH29_05000 [candidate division Kazan bacterium]
MCSISRFKGIIKNYRLDSVEKILQLSKALLVHGITIEVNEAREKFKVIVYAESARIFSEEFNIEELKILVEELKKNGYIHVATDYEHLLEPLQRMLFIKPLYCVKEKLKEVFLNV